MNSIIDFCNSNQGIITLVGLFLIIPFTIFSDRMITYFKNKKHSKELQQLLLHEIWVNLNFVYEIENSYLKNIKNDGNKHIPHYPPRIDVISKFFEFDLISSLKYEDKLFLIEIYTQLVGLKREFDYWIGNTLFFNFDTDLEVYKIMSSTLLNYIDASTRNCMNFWVRLVAKYGNYSKVKKIQDFHTLLTEIKKEGKKYKCSYRASYYNKTEFENMKFDLILCWIDDFKDSKREVFEIKDFVSL